MKAARIISREVAMLPNHRVKNRVKYLTCISTLLSSLSDIHTCEEIKIYIYIYTRRLNLTIHPTSVRKRRGCFSNLRDMTSLKKLRPTSGSPLQNFPSDIFAGHEKIEPLERTNKSIGSKPFTSPRLTSHFADTADSSKFDVH